jgi:carboxyl-terminal processing protease
MIKFAGCIYKMNIMNRIKILLSAAALLILSGSGAYAQSKNFKLGQWTEIHSSIIKELNRSYVDTLPVEKVFRAGIDAMLEQLDRYTVYIPEEENEDLQMMLSKTYGGIGAIIHKKKVLSLHTKVAKKSLT